MPVIHDNWPGSYGAVPTLKNCRKCGQPFATYNPKCAKKCPACRKKRGVKSSPEVKNAVRN